MMAQPIASDARPCRSRLWPPGNLAHREWHNLGIRLLEGRDALVQVFGQGHRDPIGALIQPTSQREHMGGLATWLGFVVDQQDLQC